MDILIISLSTLIASGLTLFSGFGLGTVLTPAFALFFPVATAVAMTAVVHFASNVFKIGLVGRHAHGPTVLRFGVPAALAALVGAGLLSTVSQWTPWFTYQIGGNTHVITPVKACVGVVITVFALLELSPAFARLAFAPRWLIAGGLLSGFFGGLSGNQGALRSAFLIKAGLSQQAYVGTGSACALLVDIARIAVYGWSAQAFWSSSEAGNASIPVLAATVSAFLGAYLGSRWLEKVTLRLVELLVATLMVGIGIALTSGLL